MNGDAPAAVARLGGARRWAPSGTACRAPTSLELYVEHGEQTERSNGGPIACFDRQLARKAG